MRTILFTVLATVACCAVLFFLFFFSFLTYPQSQTPGGKSGKQETAFTESKNTSSVTPAFIGPPPGAPHVNGPTTSPPNY